ncbi:Major Facilitator Superfamily protein [Halogranum gelatinilyticum]|uniref:Major Facilitator Superfamily protein n=1 Tax=Halogranum gelatinilyticum TaxID=660521 RepID=A0A1G9RHB0_9EURY|nr:MFS transporter [Halogranum gelatinilyticum]SDM22247.1 Major Facilitator Superfamily protein [Halogranum gelatinilyticum]
MGSQRRDRVVLATAVWAVLVSQVLLYPGIADLVVALGAEGDPSGVGIASLDAGMYFLVAEFAAFVLFAPVWGALSDSLGKRVPLVVVGALGGAAAYLTLALGPSLGVSFPVALAIRAVGGAFTIGAFSLAISMLSDLSGGHGRNMGAAGIAIGLGAALGSVVGGQLTVVDPLAPVVAAAGVLVVVAVLLATVTDRAQEADDGDADVGSALAKLTDRPALLVPFAFGFIDRMTAGFFALVGVYYFRVTFGLDAAGAGLLLAAFFLPFALFQYPAGIVSDRVGRFLPVVVGSLCYGVTIVAVVFAPTPLLAAGVMVLVGVAGALVAPATMALVTDVVAPDERGAALGAFNVFGSLGFLTGFLLGGFATELAGFLPAFLLVGGAEMAIALVAARAVKRLSARTVVGDSVSTPTGDD